MFTSYIGLEPVGLIATQVLDQKAICQQDPDQDEEEEAPEDQAEYDSMLISSAGDLVAAIAFALGSDFSQGFSAFFPLITKYYVSILSAFFPLITKYYVSIRPNCSCRTLRSTFPIIRKRTGR